jgi:hypothetical protein
MTLISYQSSGGDKGRCDARCYNAKHDPCNCICRGANHGKGLTVAAENTVRYFDRWVQKYRDANPDVVLEVSTNWSELRPHLTGNLFQEEM